MNPDDVPEAIQPRLMTPKAAAIYVGVSTPTFVKWVASGLLPAALPGMRRWDRKAIDAALDRLSGLTTQPDDQGDEIRKREREARIRARPGAEANKACSRINRR